MREAAEQKNYEGERPTRRRHCRGLSASRSIGRLRARQAALTTKTLNPFLRRVGWDGMCGRGLTAWVQGRPRGRSEVPRRGCPVEGRALCVDGDSENGSSRRPLLRGEASARRARGGSAAKGNPREWVAHRFPGPGGFASLRPEVSAARGATSLPRSGGTPQRPLGRAATAGSRSCARPRAQPCARATPLSGVDQLPLVFRHE